MYADLDYELNFKSGPQQFNEALIYEISSYKAVRFGNNFNIPINSLKSIEKIYGKNIMNSFPQILDTKPNDFLIKIYFGDAFNQDVNFCLPDTILLIKFGYYFNKSVYALPKFLQSLTFGVQFNHSVDNLPLGLKELVFNEQFNQKVNKLPEYLQSLTFGMNFNQEVNSLPPRLKYLNLGYSFNHNLDNLPLTIRVLTLSNKFSHPLDMLPSSIEIIDLPLRYTYSLENLPCSVKEIKCGKDVFQRENFTNLKALLENSNIKISHTNKSF